MNEHAVAVTGFVVLFVLMLLRVPVGIAMGLAQAHGMPVPLSAVGQQLYRAAERAAGPGSSVSEMVRWIEQLTGTELSGTSVPGVSNPAGVTRKD